MFAIALLTNKFFSRAYVNEIVPPLYPQITQRNSSNLISFAHNIIIFLENICGIIKLFIEEMHGGQNETGWDIWEHIHEKRIYLLDFKLYYYLNLHRHEVRKFMNIERINCWKCCFMFFFLRLYLKWKER